MQGPHGIYPILYAFFDQQGELDRQAMRRQVEVCIDSGAQGIAILGMITEVAALSEAERRRIIEWVSEDVAQRVPLAVTIAGRSAQEQIDLARFAQTAGADWLVLQPPIGETPSSAQLQRFFDSVMEHVELPVGIQNAPEFLGVGLEPDEVLALHRQHRNFTVMKGEGPVVVVKRFLDLLGDEVAVFNGRGGLELPDNLRAGCAGMIPAPDCADVQVKIYAAEQAGDSATADMLYEQILPYVLFAMQSAQFMVLYGKQMFARRAGIEGGERCRISGLQREAFFDRALEHWSARFDAIGVPPP
jgi:dihydrodipicolinate synthase/N-acetylneuraminate lyase